MAKRTNNDLQNSTQKTKDRAKRTRLNSRMNSGAPEVFDYFSYTDIPQLIFFLVCIFEGDRITTINEMIRNVKETPNHECLKL